jgi:hypothetical protein
MKRVIFSVMFVLSAILVSELRAAITTVDVTIKAVDLKARSVTVTYQVSGEQKTTDLDVSRKAEITVNGKQATLDSVKSGQKAKVTFEKELQIVTKLDATGEDADPFGKARKAMVHTGNEPELVEISELNDQGANKLMCLSEDGLTIYWSRYLEGKPSYIWTAHRDNANTLFTNKMQLFAGNGPTASADGLELIFVNARLEGRQSGQSLFVATRESKDKPFGRPKVITELETFSVATPYLSSDGLILYCRSESAKAAVVYFTRNNKSDPWNNVFKILPLINKRISCFAPFVTADGLNLLVHTDNADNGKQGNLLCGSRSSADKPFSNFKIIEFDNLPPLVGGKPYYVAATNELFIQKSAESQGKQGIWVIKNFKIPQL